MLPVIVLVLHPVTGAFPRKRVFLLGIAELGYDGAPYFWSVLHMAKSYKDSIDTEFTFQYYGVVPEPEIPGDEIECHTRRGRPRLEGKFGSGIVNFVKDLIFSRGQDIVVDSHRLRTTGNV